MKSSGPWTAIANNTAQPNRVPWVRQGSLGNNNHGTRPATTSAAALADKVRRASGRMLCDFAFFVGATRDNIHDLPGLEMLPAAAGVKVFMGSSTGELLVEDDESVARILKRIRRRAAFHSEDEHRLKSRKSEQRDGEHVRQPLCTNEGGFNE